MIGGERHASRFEFSKDTADFESEGVDCAGWIYRPDRPRTAPLVVLGPGLATERTFGYPTYAERLAARGYAVFLFDYRHFGDSEGSPRQLVSIPAQRADWQAAIDCATGLDGIDSDRVALWGASLAGGLVLELAASDPRVDAVVAQSPIVDGGAVLRPNGWPWLARAVAAGVRDRVTGLVGRRRWLPVVPGFDADGVGEDEEDTEVALLADPTAASTLSELVPLRSDWENRVPARIVLDLLRYRPITTAEEVRVPTLLLTGVGDSIVPPKSVAAAADALPDATFVTLPTGHFQLFEEPWVERALGHQLAFLNHVL